MTRQKFKIWRIFGQTRVNGEPWRRQHNEIESQKGQNTKKHRNLQASCKNGRKHPPFVGKRKALEMD
jgi:hypothetical protein